MRNKPIALRSLLVMATFALMGQNMAQTTENGYPSLFANKPKELSVGFGIGRSFFTNPEIHGGNKSNVFFGAFGINYGISHQNRYYLGVGADVEHLDMIDGAISVPVYAQAHAFIIGDKTQGLFIDAKAGYIFGGRREFPVEIFDSTSQLYVPVGKTERSLSGFYGQVGFGYRIQKIDFYVAYNYRSANYKTTYYLQIPQINNQTLEFTDDSVSKTIHTLLFGIRYVIF